MIKGLKSKLKLGNKAYVANQIVKFIDKYNRKFAKEGIVVGISGGIDSALSAKLALDAVGKESITLLHIVERDTPKESSKYAQLIADYLGLPLKIRNITIPLAALKIYNLQPILGFISPEKTKIYYAKKRYKKLNGDGPIFLKHLLGNGDTQFKKDIAYYEAKARTITLVAYMYANLENKIVIDTANKTELNIGYYVRYGESGDIMPLSNLYKTQVRELAEFVGIPKEILDRPPTPDIIPGMTDNLTLGIKYTDLDCILLALGEGIAETKISEELNILLSRIKYVKQLVEYAKVYSTIPIMLKK